MTKRQISDVLFASAERLGLDVTMVRFGEDTVGVWCNGLHDWTTFDSDVFTVTNAPALDELLDFELTNLLPRLRPEHP